MSDNTLSNVWHFRTIGLGTINYRRASKRLAKEASSLGLFETSKGYDEKYIRKFSPDFWNAHKNMLRARNPGFGWWVWKPEFIRMCLERLPEDHGVMYSDAGNYIGTTPSDSQNISIYLNLASKHNVIGSNSQDFIEKDWSSPDLMNLLDLDASDRNSNQFLGGFLLVTNTPEGRNFVSKWSKLVCIENHRFLMPSLNSNDSPNNSSHDQSILSCLLKKASKPSVYIGDKTKLGSIRAVRHRFGFPFHDANKSSVVIFKTIFFLSRIRLGLERRIFSGLINRKLYLKYYNHD